MGERGDLALALRAWRDRLDPDEVGLLGSGGGRRVPGLRREELAQLAGLSVDYLVRLEQGRASNPSPEVLAALARSLRLDDAERDFLYRVAGSAPPGPVRVPTRVSPGVRRVLDRLGDTPAAIYSAAWELIEANPCWEALFGPLEAPPGRERNLVWSWFTRRDSKVVRNGAEVAAFARSMVTDLRQTAARYSGDPELAAMIAELVRSSDWFAELWAGFHVATHRAERKTIDSPTIGRITLDCDVLYAPEEDLRLVVYTAAPRSEEAVRLEGLKRGAPVS